MASLKNLLFCNVATVHYFHSCSLFSHLLYIGNSIFIFSCLLSYLFAFSIPFEEKNNSSNSEITAGTIFERVNCGRTSGTWLIFSSLLHSLIYIRKFISLFPFFFFYPVPVSDMVYYHDGSFSGLDWWSAVITFTFIHCKSLGSLSLLFSDEI